MRERLPVLDVLRGIAILGTFASNVWLLAFPGGPQAWLAAGTPTGEWLLRGLVNGKFLALLTLLFGVGLELQYRSAVRRGARWPGRYLLRALVLLVEGALHYVLVFEFDVLMGYAVTSVVVAYLIGRSDRVQKACTVAVGAVFVLLMGLLTATRTASPEIPAVPVADLGYGAQVLGRLRDWATFRAELVVIVPLGVVLFLLGARLHRAGVFDDRGAAPRRRLMVLGAVALPVNLLTSYLGPAWFLVDRYLLAPLVALGLLAGVTHLVRAGWAPRGLTAVGRTALSCYVLQNVLASVLCYRWGLGLAGPETWRVLLIWAAVSGLCTVVAVLWLRRFDRGPLELLTHRLVRPAPL
ncbi:DUF418 domain-containing protein [Pseudonocardia pini]|uniref:DUF418 domain-containing protein n=1 Tax=Pseudonocardia pini TaxID=2758030 RepID=UPI0015F0098A|nr:DUF418 domain-containing protein [Pseudonocardia pini]